LGHTHINHVNSISGTVVARDEGHKELRGEHVYGGGHINNIWVRYMRV
jgi:hypothetical protein